MSQTGVVSEFVAEMKVSPEIVKIFLECKLSYKAAAPFKDTFYYVMIPLFILNISVMTSTMMSTGISMLEVVAFLGIHPQWLTVCVLRCTTS